MNKKINKILIVDDSPVARKIMKSCMPRDRGYEFHEASDGLDGLKKFKDITPDVIFMDLTMPIMDGFAALEEIKKVAGDAIVIVCTADIQKNSILKVMHLGAFTYLKKPPTKEKIEEVLARAETAFGQGEAG